MLRVPPGFNALVSRKARIAAEQASGFTVPIFGVDKRHDPEFHGTGVLLRYANRFLLVSAAHVFDRLLNGVHLLLPRRERTALSNAISLTLRDSHARRTGDEIDLGFVDLSDDEVEAAGAENFLEMPKSEAVEPNWAVRYVVLGYAEKDQRKFEEESVFRVNQSYYTSPEVSHSTYNRAGHQPSDHILLEFNRSRIAGPRGRGGLPPLHGLSGAGVWRINPYSNAASKPELVGFLAGRAPRYQKALFGSRLSVLRSILDRKTQIIAG